MIERILLNQDEFQNILEQHLQTLQLQVENLAEIQQKCLKLTQKNIPLLDAVVDGEFYAYNDYDKDIKTLFQKITEFMQPYSVITIGRKTTPYQLVKEMFGYFIIVGFYISGYVECFRTSFVYKWYRMDYMANWNFYLLDFVYVD